MHIDHTTSEEIMAPTIIRRQAKTGTAVVSSHMRRAKSDEQLGSRSGTHRLEEVASDAPLASVTVSAGGTYSLGNYETARIDVSVTLPCRPEDVDKTYQEASAKVCEFYEEEKKLWVPD